MSAKRIRCECGRVYEPAKNPTCPACGATASTGVLDRPKRSDVDDDEPVVRRKEERERDEDATPLAVSPRLIAIIGGSVLGLALIIFLLTRGGSDKHKTDVLTPTPAPTATATATATVQPSATPTPSASASSGQSQQQGFVIPQPFDLPAALANAAPGATIKIPPGFYAGGLVISKPVKLIGNAGQVIIQSDGRECLSVRAPGVFVQGVQFMCNGIGELAAISVADGAELELDGCRVQSSTALGLTSGNNASFKATGTTFTSSNGLALRLLGGKTSLTQSTFADSKIALSVLNGGSVELQSCAFERNGTGDAQGGIIFANGQGTSVSASDCHFTGNTGGVYVNDNAAFTATKSSFKENGANCTVAYGVVAVRKGGHATISSSSFEQNQQGIAVTDGGVLELTKCAFLNNGVQMRQPILATMPISLNGQGSTATVRNCSLGDSAQFAIAMVNGASATFEDVEIVGSRSIGLAIGDPNGAPAHVEVKRGRFQQNVMGFGIYAGSSANIEDSEFRENNDGLLASDRKTEVALQKVRFQSNKDHGLAVFAEAHATAKECQFIGNTHGAQSGAERRTSGHASLTLEDCEFGENRAFGVGAYSQSEVILRRCKFDGSDKQNIYKERSAMVQNEAASTPTTEESPSPGASAEPASDASPSPAASASPQRRTNSRPTRKTHRPEDDATRILRHIFGPH